MNVVLDTERLILRPWTLDDAQELYLLASNPAVGPACGWAPHRSVAESRVVLRNVLMAPESYAVVLKYTYIIIGCVSLRFHRNTFTRDDLEPEIGFWIGEPFWGFGYAQEASEAIIDRAFNVLDCVAVWGCYFDDNERANKVLSRMGFIYEQTDPWVRTTTGNHARHQMCLTRDRWPQYCQRRAGQEGKPFAVTLY